MKRINVFLIGLGIVCSLFLIGNYLIERENSFIIFLEGDSSLISPKEVMILVDKEVEYSGVIGYDMIGAKEFSLNLKGGIHTIEILYDDQKLSHRFYVLFGETFSVAIWNIEEDVSLNFNRHFFDFMFA